MSQFRVKMCLKDEGYEKVTVKLPLSYFAKHLCHRKGLGCTSRITNRDQGLPQGSGSHGGRMHKDRWDMQDCR